MPAAPAPLRRRFGLGLFVAGLALGYAFFLAWYHAPYAGSTDAAGYMNSARLMLDGHLATPLRVPADFPADIPRARLQPLGFRLDAAQQELLPVYPVGLPLHFAALGVVTGLGGATTTVAVLSALAFAWLLYLTSREFGVAPDWSAGVALLGALSPLTLNFALQPMSDVVAAMWVIAAVYFALRAERRVAWAAGAGAAFALAVLVRPTNLLLIIPLALALPARLRPWIAFGLGGLPGALFLALYNHRLFGSALTSGYGDVRSLFSVGYVPGNAWHYLQWIPVIATPLVLAAVALPWTALARRRQAVLLAWAGVIFLLYATYYCTNETWWYLRYILPGLPALGIAAALVLQERRYPSWIFSAQPAASGNAAPASPARSVRVSAALLLLAAGLAWGAWWTRELRATQVESDERSYPLAGRWIADNLPADGVLVAYQLSGAAYYYTDKPVLVPIDLVPAEVARLDAWLAERHRTLYAALYPDDEALIREKLPGRWEPVTRIRRVTIWRRSAGSAP